MYSWNIEEQTTLQIARILDFQGYASWDKIQYLGLPLTLGENRASLWNEAINNIKTKIATWGGQWLNYAGKLTLLKFVLSSVPIYQTSYLLASKTIIDQISQLLKSFLWQGGKRNEKKFHLVSWDKVKRTKLEGGLQIKDHGRAKIALGGKILWHLYSNKHHPVSQLLRNKYLKGVSFRNLQADRVPKGMPL